MFKKFELSYGKLRNTDDIGRATRLDKRYLQRKKMLPAVPGAPGAPGGPCGPEAPSGPGAPCGPAGPGAPRGPGLHLQLAFP